MSGTTEWIRLPDDRVALSGLAWADGNWPSLWRLPADAMDRMPDGVRSQALFPAGAKIRVSTDSSQLHLEARSVSEFGGQGQGLDLYVDGLFWHTVPVTASQETTVCCFEGCSRSQRDIALYLPHRREVQITAIGLDGGAEVAARAIHHESRPVVLYGSSVAQGAGASRPGMSYGNILARDLDVDLVNLGFGGAGKAEPEVVELVGDIDACCYLFDLGKSYGRQPADPYTDMLGRIRSLRPEVPMVCVTPIYSTREGHDPEYAELSRHTREVVHAATDELLQKRDPNLSLVDGLELLGREDSDGFSSDGVHPGDLGYQRMAERMKLILRRVLKH